WHGGARRVDVPLHRARPGDDLGRRGAREQPDLHADRRRHHDAADPRLYRLGLLGLPRQGGPRRLPLMDERGRSAEQRPLWQRLAWLAAIWIASVAVLGVVAWILRLWIA